MEIRYRQICEKDGYAWYALLNRVWRAAYRGIFPEEVFDARDKRIADRARAFTAEKYLGERKIACVAECEGRIVGLMYGALDSDYAPFKNDYADLVALYVDPDFQSMGIGTALKDRFLEWAKEKQAKRFVIGVLKENAKARSVYEAWGGTLSEYEQDFMMMQTGYPEVFYTFEL